MASGGMGKCESRHGDLQRGSAEDIKKCCVPVQLSPMVASVNLFLFFP